MKFRDILAHTVGTGGDIGSRKTFAFDLFRRSPGRTRFAFPLRDKDTENYGPPRPRINPLSSGALVQSESGVGEVKELRKSSYRFVMQGDGNVVLYDGSTPKWASGTHGKPNAPFKLQLQGDGNLVAYDKKNNAIWASGSRGNNCVLKLQGDGNVVIYGDDGQPKWSTGTGT